MAYAVRTRFNAAYCWFSSKYLTNQRSPVDVKPIYRTFVKREIPDDDDVPVKYTSSAAAKESAKAFREKHTTEDEPFVQSVSLMISLAALLIYFGILREENDIDEKLDQDLFSKVPELKAVQNQLSTRAGRELGRKEITS